MGAFKILMWKQYTVRKRRLFQTLVELIAPIIISVVLFLLKSSMQKKHAPAVLRTLPIQKFSADTPDIRPRILVHPNSEATRNLMSNADYFGLSRAKALSKLTRSVPNNTNLVNEDDLQRNEVLVKFENMTGSSMPDKLHYTIAVKSSFESGIPVLRSHEKFENFNEPLLRLQWAIDSSFLKLKSSDGPNLQKISFEALDSPTMRAVNYLYVNSVFFLLPYVLFLGPLLPFIFLMIRLLEERSTGIQELVKMVGVTPAMLGISQFLNSMPPCLLFSGVSTILFKYGGDNAMVPATNTLILFTGLFLHYITMVSLAYAASFLAKDAQYTVSLSMFVYIGIWVPIRMLGQESKSKVILFFKGLLPHGPTYWYLNEIHNTEIYYEGIGINFNNWNEHYGLYKSGGDNGTVVAAFLMMLLQTLIFFTISWYLEKVRPGKYGVALPWNFPCQREYWRMTQNIPDKIGEALTSHEPEYQKFFEQPPSNMEAGIKIAHVSKIFGYGKKQFQALNNVSLDIYKGEITVLLGHNGAGKTTLMSIITGMINPSSGKIYVNGMDTVTQQTEVRKHLGLCPQHNLFFPDLTVMEHFLFFSMIKGGSFHEANKSAHVLMQQLNLSDKADSRTSELSGGMLRRLQLGCALCGNASVLILDEPTSGLDVEARRELWDMLLALRGDRTLVLTTHFMEEADVLGDRLAALHAGRLRSHATPMFLKRAVGSGYRLSVTTRGEPNEANITQAVRGIIGGANLMNRSNNTLLYEVPAGANLPTLFKNVESRKEELDIEYLSIGITTLEEVFLELCTDVNKDEQVDEGDITKGPAQYQYVNGCTRTCRQMRALFRRQLDYTLSKRTAYFILQILMPFVMCLCLTELFNNMDISPYASNSSRFNDMPLNFDIYTNGISKKAMYRLNRYTSRRSNTMEIIKKSFPNVEFRSFKDVHNCTCGKPTSNYLNRFLVGIDVNDTEAKVLYSPSVGHSASVGLNFLSNVLAVQRMPSADGKTISTKISKVQLTEKPKIKFYIPKLKMNCALFAIFNIFMLMATAINDVTLPCRERLTVARHTHVMAGCPPVLYWLTTFLYHMFGFLLFCCTATLCAAAFMDYDKTIDDKETLVAYTVALVLCGMDFYAFAYFISYYFNERGASMLLIGFTIVFGFLAPILMMALEDLKTSDNDPDPIFNRMMDVVGVALPAYMFTDVVSKMTDTSRFNSYCKHNYQYCAILPYYSAGFDSKKCCKDGSPTKAPYDHFAFSKYSMGRPLIIISIQFVIFAYYWLKPMPIDLLSCLLLVSFCVARQTLVLLLEYKLCNRWWNSIGRMRATQYPDKQFQSPQVAEEKIYVDNTFCLPKEQITDSLLLHKAWKTYYKLFDKPTFALRDANFSVRKGECFGILGVNGAGKTTTFKVISYEEAATKGNSYATGHYLSSNSTQYMRCLGYCPQFCGLDDFRPGADNLRMLLILRGFKDEDVKRETAIWLAVVGMTKAGHRPVAEYSGGMVRRLATAASLCSGSPVTLLDEPTAGVDTAARRLLWAALKRGLLNDRAIVLTSHSMDEMEMLCRRVTVLSNGEMCVLGTPAALRDEHAPGNGIVLKLRASVVQSHVGPERVKHLKDALQQKFDCTLKDEHLTSLHYRINEKLEYSEVFSRMEAIESQFSDLLEDFSVQDTTLEDVFLKFAHD